jgi:uncharacterized protein YqjF (DUF2071 family)
LSRRFLTAEWRNLLMLNYVVEPALLRPYVPVGTELDTWHGQAYLSLVGFLFADTRLLGVPIPWHRTFEEVNLRFYVRREVAGETRRAVTFIRELVPRTAIAVVARLAYNEPYTARPMRHRFGGIGPNGVPSEVEYGWRVSRGWAEMSAQPVGEGTPVGIGSEEEFITEHYWGYTRQRDGSTIEYQVTHPSWRVWSVETAQVSGHLAPIHGYDFAGVLHGVPASAFLADGSAVTVYSPERLGRA